jgi:hypothetical protein
VASQPDNSIANATHLATIPGMRIAGRRLPNI